MRHNHVVKSYERTLEQKKQRLEKFIGDESLWIACGILKAEIALLEEMLKDLKYIKEGKLA